MDKKNNFLTFFPGGGSSRGGVVKALMALPLKKTLFPASLNLVDVCLVSIGQPLHWQPSGKLLNQFRLINQLINFSINQSIN